MTPDKKLQLGGWNYKEFKEIRRLLLEFEYEAEEFDIQNLEKKEQ